MKRAAFFFGAGISKASGKPLASEITERALRTQWHLTSKNDFLPGPEPSFAPSDSVTPAVQRFLTILYSISGEYILELSRTPVPRKAHYEDLFSLAEQAFRPASDHVPNLAVVEFLRRLRAETFSLHTGFRWDGSGGVGFAGLAEAACDFLHAVVHHLLTAGDNPRAGLDVIPAAARCVDEVDIFTLNHDLLIESQCHAEGIAYEDGFANRRGEIDAFSFWSHDAREKVRLFKLHGSVNWYLYEFSGHERQYGIPRNGPYHSKDENGRALAPLLGGKAAFLSGTIVKEQHYGNGLFGELFSEFRQHLRYHKHLICCGYGFGDTGVNNRLLQWLCDSMNGSNRLVILHDTSETRESELFDNAPIWLTQMRSKGRVILHSAWLANCKVADLESYFDRVP